MASLGLPQELAERLEEAALQPGRWRGGWKRRAGSREVLYTSSFLKWDLATKEGEKMVDADLDGDLF